MDERTFQAHLAKKERLWNATWMTLLALVAVVSFWFGWTSFGSDQPLFTSMMAVILSTGICVTIISWLDNISHRTFLKRYWIEDHGDVIKLFGSVRLIDMGHAYREVLSFKPGFTIVKNMDRSYGCTIAAVRATDEELKAKEKLLEMGIKTHEI